MTIVPVLAHDGFRPNGSARSPLLVVHAGTHKTASSYIQNRLEANQAALSAQGIVHSWPRRQGRKHKGLVKAMFKGRKGPWKRYLNDGASSAWQVLVSAEQFTPAFTEASYLSFLDGIARSHARTLRVVLFLRDQPDFLNSMYAHTVRRLYHHYPFGRYVSRKLRFPSWFPNYHRWLDAVRQHPTAELLVLPYRSPGLASRGETDPFIQLADGLGWVAPEQGWLPASRQSINTQVGSRGIWLALEVGKALAAKGINPRSLRNTGGLIRKIAEREGWTHQRFQGFEPDAYLKVRQLLQSANDPLAMQAWGAPWAEVFPSNPQPRSIFAEPETDQDAKLMNGCVQEVVTHLLEQM